MENDGRQISLNQRNGGRWKGTQEQVSYLRRLFSEKGIRKPSKSQISSITVFLQRYGRIAERNVIYWFQNQRARLRKQTSAADLCPAQVPTPRNDDHDLDRDRDRDHDHDDDHDDDHGQNSRVLPFIDFFARAKEKEMESKNGIDSSS